MAMYEYKCPICGDTKETVSAVPINCRHCNVDMKRIYSFVPGRGPTNAGMKRRPK